VATWEKARNKKNDYRLAIHNRKSKNQIIVFFIRQFMHDMTVVSPFMAVAFILDNKCLTIFQRLGRLVVMLDGNLPASR